MIFLNIVRGILMAFADSVPGVSGGTIAFVLGFYTEFIESLSSLVSKRPSAEKKSALIFLIKLGIGWIIGFIFSVLFISSLFETHIYMISSLFIGFILFSIPLIYIEEKEALAHQYQYYIYTLVGIIIVALITYFNPTGQISGINLPFQSFSIGMALYLFFAGAIAISAMVLPGLSGSTILLILGLYAPLMSSIRSLLTFNFTPLPMIICFGLGILAGIFSVIRTLNALLVYKRSQLIYFILGLMIGSIYAVIMGPTTLAIPEPPITLSTFNIFSFLLGGLIILGLEMLKRILPNQ